MISKFRTGYKSAPLLVLEASKSDIWSQNYVEIIYALSQENQILLHVDN